MCRAVHVQCCAETTLGRCAYAYIGAGTGITGLKARIHTRGLFAALHRTQHDNTFARDFLHPNQTTAAIFGGQKTIAIAAIGVTIVALEKGRTRRATVSDVLVWVTCGNNGRQRWHTFRHGWGGTAYFVAYLALCCAAARSHLRSDSG